MNKAFLREPDQRAEYCPRCGTQGEPVGAETLRAHLSDEQRAGVAEPANFCPSPQCEVAYFDGFERAVLATALAVPVYPKDPDAPICACFGLTREDIEQDVREGSVARVKAILQKAQSPDARCTTLAANGRSCVAYVQRYYMQCRGK
jgi:Zinc binding domain